MRFKREKHTAPPPPKYVAIEIEGHRAVHATSQNGAAATLCGLDGNDPGSSADQRTVELTPNDRISCAACLQICRYARKYRPSDFRVGLWERAQ